MASHIHRRVALLLGCVASVSLCTPSTMRAFVAKSDGDSFDSHFPAPKIGDLHRIYNVKLNHSSCEVLINVKASSVSPSDISPSIAVKPHVLGSDIAGVVIAVGSGCQRLKSGDKVWGDIGANTINKVTGDKTKELGGYAEYAVALESQLAVIPDTWSFQEAGALPKVALTSYKALVWYAAAPWSTGPTVLILGGSGGTGSTGLQLAKSFGAKELITTTSATNAEYCTALGATRVIDYHKEDWWNSSVIQDGSVDVIFDTVGQAGTGDRAMQKIKDGGHYVTIVGALAEHPKATVKQAMFINSDTNLESAELLEALSKLGREKKLHMHIDETYPLEHVGAAFNASKGGHVVGKLSISV